MRYISTRNAEQFFSFRDTALNSLATDGGQFVPETLPVIDRKFMLEIAPLTFPMKAARILHLFAPELSLYECDQITASAFSEDFFPELAFDASALNPYSGKELILSCDRGPSGFYYDYGNRLQMALLTFYGIAPERVRVIPGMTVGSLLSVLATTSLRESAVFLMDAELANESPLKGLSLRGKRYALKAEANERERFPRTLFQALCDEDERGRHYVLSDGSSWIMVLADLMLLLAGLSDLIRKELIEEGECLDIYFPSFSLDMNLAALYAKSMGADLGQSICCCNRNKAAADFLRQGRYNIERRVFRSNSPELDRVRHSNLERLLFELCGRNHERTEQVLNSLEEKSVLELEERVQAGWREHILGLYSDDQACVKTLKRIYDQTDYLLDSHTAISFSARERLHHKEKARALFILCGNPLTTTEASAEALFGRGYVKGRSFKVLLDELATEAGVEIPRIYKVEEEAERAAVFEADALIEALLND